MLFWWFVLFQTYILNFTRKSPIGEDDPVAENAGSSDSLEPEASAFRMALPQVNNILQICAVENSKFKFETNIDLFL